MSSVNSALAFTLRYIPRWLVHQFAKPYVAGETVVEALGAVRALNRQGYSATLDILGEHVPSPEEARRQRDAYRHLYDCLAEEELDSSVSLKLTHLGLEIDYELALDNLLAVVEKARQHHNALTIDMENSPYTDSTLRIYREALQHYPRVGTVLQAYLHRSLDDLQDLNADQPSLRICKGIYRETPEIAYQDRDEIRENFITLTQTLLRGAGYAEIATHDIFLIDSLETWIENVPIPPDRFEFQVLYGVPMGNRLQRLLAKGYRVRVYVPFGEAWMEYSLRRLKENPHIAGYVLGNLFKRRVFLRLAKARAVGIQAAHENR